jgi:hypothetical protein
MFRLWGSDGTTTLLEEIVSYVLEKIEGDCVMKVDEYEMTLDDLPASWIEALYEINEEEYEEDEDSVDTTIFPWHMGWDQYIAFLEELVEESRGRANAA